MCEMWEVTEIETCGSDGMGDVEDERRGDVLSVAESALMTCVVGMSSVGGLTSNSLLNCLTSES